MAQRPSARRRAKYERAAQWNALPPEERARLAHLAPLIALEPQLVGRLVLPSDPDYEQDRQEFNPAFQEYPAGIIYCEVEEDVRLCLDLIRTPWTRVAIRSGGHSTAGYSVVTDGLVIDLSAFDCVCIDEDALTVSVGVGANFDKLNGALNSTVLHVPTGACGDVCIGGFVQGGGYGYTSRMFGVQCDSVLAMRVMLADGNVVVADASNGADLLWAMCGGTGGNFGVLLEVTYQLQRVENVWGWSIQWDAQDAPAVLQALQAGYMASGAAPELGMMINLGFNAGQQVLLAQGMWVGDREDGLAAVGPLMNYPSAQLLADQCGLYGEMDVYLDNAPYPIPNPPTGSKESKRSGYIATTLPIEAWQAVVAYSATAPNPNCTMIIEPYGGAINAAPITLNAFVHRTSDMNVFMDVFWIDDADKPALLSWLDGFMNLIAPYLNGEVYQNYPYRELPNYANAYWGQALPQLQQAKARYDPHNLFQFPQGVPLPQLEGVAGKK
jgi:FAD/FMN-containing dehydrogenase